MAALCKAPTKSAGIGLSITAVCKNAGKKTLGQDDFFVVKKEKKKSSPLFPSTLLLKHCVWKWKKGREKKGYHFFRLVVQDKRKSE